MYADALLPAQLPQDHHVSSPSAYSCLSTQLIPPLHCTALHFTGFSFRPLYVLEKVFATFGVFSLIYTLTEHYIMPHIPKPGDPLLRAYANLALPMVINYLL